MISSQSLSSDDVNRLAALPPAIRLKIAHVYRLFTNTWPGLIGALASAIVLVLALREVVPPTRLIIWISAYIALQVPRYLLVIRFAKVQPQGAAALTWGTKFSIYTVATGLVWGAAGIVLFPEGSQTHQFMMAVFVAGIGAAAAVSYSALTECYVPTISVVLVPFGASYLYRGGEICVVIGTVIILFAVVLIVTARAVHDAISTALQSAFEKSDLAASLMTEKAKVDNLNRELQAEVEERTRTEQDLSKSEERYSRLVSTMKEGVSIQDQNDNLMYVNDQFCTMIGRSAHELVGLPLAIFLNDEDKNVLAGQLEDLRQGNPGRCEVLWLHANGSSVPTLMSAVPIMDAGNGYQGSFSVMTDITELKRTETQLKQTLAEKEVLLREIHHRVKNNLAVISSLLMLQARHATEEAHRHVLEDARARILSMALAHDRLSASHESPGVYMDQYLDGLIGDILFSMTRARGAIQVQKHIEPVFLNVAHAIPVGFIVTELVSNALKHAFPDKTDGTIWVRFEPCGEFRYELSVRDDGVGMPETPPLEKGNSLGMKIVKMFSEQLRAEIRVSCSHGTEYRVLFSTPQHADGA